MAHNPHPGFIEFHSNRPQDLEEQLEDDPENKSIKSKTQRLESKKEKLEDSFQ
jgi:hypothetical protein